MLTIISAYVLDLIFGDPQWHWHPVRLIGRTIERLEGLLNRDRVNKLFAGIMLVILVVGLTTFCVWISLRLVKIIHPIFLYIVSALLIYFVLSIKALGVEANKVYKALKHKNIQGARKGLSMIVGRDTDKLEEPEIIKATIETTAESIMDGIIAPLFYAFLGGPVLAWAYKAINTLDSMVGYRSERFIEFGKATAKLDGLANFIPSKITCFLISVSSWFYGKDWISSIKWGLKYFFKGPEKNSEATEAAMAGALKIRLGGLNFYNSAPIQKPFIGDKLQPLNMKHIKQSITIAYICSALFMGAGIFLFWLIGRR